MRTKRANTAVGLFEKSSPPIVSFLEKRADEVGMYQGAGWAGGWMADQN